MADYEAAFKVVMGHEDSATHPGLITKNGTTPETFTRYGVDQRYHPELANAGFYSTMPADKAFAVAATVFRTYWMFDKVTDQVIATKLFDAAVNMGQGNMLPVVQKVLNGLGQNLLSWHWGPAMENAVNACGEGLLGGLCDGFLDYYKKVALRKNIELPGGWKTRALWKG